MKAIVFLTLVVLGLFIFDTPTTEPQPKETVQKTWSKEDSRAYARDRLTVWHEKEWSCLNRLWGKESAWNPRAFNTTKVMGKNAGGIPQLLGLDPKIPAPRQIERGLDYIYYRYGTPCKAWKFFERNGYH
jgi:hypothetical protein